MATGINFSLYGIYRYFTEIELNQFYKHVSQVTSSVPKKFRIEDKQYRTFFNEKLDLWTRQVHVLQNLLYDEHITSEISDFYENKKWILQYYDHRSVINKPDINAISVTESICEECALEWLKGAGFKQWEAVQKEGMVYETPEGIQIFIYKLSFIVFF